MNLPQWATDMVADLKGLAKPGNPDRATLAHLRRGLSADPAYVLSRVGWLFRGVPDTALEDAILGAGLFALSKGDCADRKDWSFGRAFGSIPGGSASIERRFVDLLDTDADDLPYKLRQAFTLIAQHQLPLDWSQLLFHLGQWGHPDRWVQKRWARDFWAVAAQADVGTADQPQIVEG
jgi:CRISPR system Cascade subunit CasB